MPCCTSHGCCSWTSPAPGWAGNGHGPDQRGWITRPVGSVDQAHILLDELVRAGTPIAELHLDEPTLEDAYLALTGSQPSTAPAAAPAAARA